MLNAQSMNQQHSHESRREFLKASAAAAIAAPFVLTSSRGQDSPGEMLRVGLIGCGGRGSGAAAQALAADRNIVLTAIGDAFEEQIKRALPNLQKTTPDKVKVNPDRCFTGLDAYKKVLESGVDVVILATPPGFRPLHLKAAIDAGKHVFAEKPLAVDAPGVRMVLAAAEEAKKKNLTVASGFCWRSHYPKRATFQKVLGGAVGEIQTVYNTYNTGPVKDTTIRKPDWTPMETQVHNWYQFTWLSGDHIVEQAVHSLDMMSWAMGDVPPVRITGHGGRQVRTSLGNIYDHFAVVYEYENGAKGFHFSRQIAGCSNDYAVTIAGTKGRCLVDCSRGIHRITGENSWTYEGAKNDMYQTEHDEVFAAIRAGKPINHGTWMAQSTMLAIAGRMAAYTGQTITWDEAMKSQENLLPSDLRWDAPIEVPPVAQPGKTKLV
jgi:myo-inositol 2-dehydrogenase / D-chiro-inositol 1-dehydrogenase